MSELLHFDAFHRARVVVAVARGQLGHDVDLNPYLESVPADLSGIANLPIERIKGIGTAFGYCFP